MNNFNIIDGLFSNNLYGISDPMGGDILGGGSTADGITSTQVADFIPEVWSTAILDSFDKKSVMLGLCNDHSAALAGGGDVVNLPKLGYVQVADAPAFGAALSFVDVSDSGDKLKVTIDQHEVAHLLLPDIVKIQSSFDLVSLYGQRIGVALAEAIDNYIMGTVILPAHSTATGPASGAEVDLNGTMVSNIDAIVAKCVAETGSTDGWSLVLGPTLYATLADVGSGAGFAYGTQGSPLGSGFASTGQVGTIMGMPVMVSNSPYLDAATVSASTNKNIAAWNGFHTDASDADDKEFLGMAVHQDALHCAFKKKGDLNVTYEHLYLSHLMTAEAAFGVTLDTTVGTAGKRRMFMLTDLA